MIRRAQLTLPTRQLLQAQHGVLSRRQALATGLSLVAVGQGLVMNPDWVELARDGKAAQIATALDLTEAPALAIPGKLAGVIGAMTGWFALREAEYENA